MLNTDDFEDSLDEAFGFEEEDGNQTDLAEDDATGESDHAEPEEPTDEPQEPSQSEETTGEVTTEDAEEVPAEGTPEADSNGSDPNQQFISVKYDKETRQVSMEDAPGWIQKGMNYDRVKEQLDTSRQNEQALQDKLTQQGEIMETLELISQTVNVPIPELLEQLHVNAVKGTGKSETEAKAIIRADKLERQLKSKDPGKAKEGPQEDAKTQQVAAELADFRKQFPSVDLNDSTLVEQLRPYVQSGMNLTSAYLKLENERQAAEIVRLQQEQQQKQAAQEQNKKNRAKTPGSMQDSGGGRTKDLADIFEEELFK